MFKQKKQRTNKYCANAFSKTGFNALTIAAAAHGHNATVEYSMMHDLSFTSTDHFDVVYDSEKQANDKISKMLTLLRAIIKLAIPLA